MAKSDDRSTAAARLRDDALSLHAAFKGKIQTVPKCPVRDLADFSIWYTPGVAAPCQEIHKAPERVYDYTNKGNSVAVVSDGTVRSGSVISVPRPACRSWRARRFCSNIWAASTPCRSASARAIPRTSSGRVRLLEPSFGGINLEDIAQPKCFTILDRLRAEMTIPAWHDDQQGTAAVVLAGLINALAVVGKKLCDIRLALIGMGAANVATYRLLAAAGVAPPQVVACDSTGTLHRKRTDLATLEREFPQKWRVATETNPDAVTGGIAEAVRGADVCIAFTRSAPGIIRPDWPKAMGRDAILFACANPVPEIWPEEAIQAGVRIAATGRSDFPNQVNNSLCFPGIFRACSTSARAPSPTAWRSPPPRPSRAWRPSADSTTGASCRRWTIPKSPCGSPSRAPCALNRTASPC